ncbi:MAG: GAF domain-containing protein [Deltaproteobacteria bacterium]|nr:GAF domain-containing protein [Deltaproteobacteria bacterium]
MFRAAALFKRWHGFLVSAAVFALVVLRQFEPGLVLTRSILGNWRVWVLFLVLAYLLGKLFASAATRPKTSSTTRPRGHAREEAELDFTLLIFAATNLIIQLAGEYGAYLFPFNYLLMALIVIYLGTPTAVAFSFFIPALDALGRFFAGASFVTVGTMLGLHTAMGLVFVGVVGYFLWSERTERARAVDKLDRLTGDAMALAGDPADSAPAVLRDRKDARDVRHTRELDEELADLVEMARDALKAEACVALFATRDRGVLRVRAMAGPSDELDEDAVIPIDGSLPGLVFRQEAPLVLNRVERRGPQLDYRRKRKGVRSLAAHPIMSGPESVGVLVADSVNEDHFDEAAREYLARVARRIEKEYSDARRVTDIDREREEFAAYYDMVKRFAETREVSEVLETAFEAGRQIVAFDAALISFAEEGDKGLVAAVADLPEKWIGLEFDTGDSLSGMGHADEAISRV